MQGFYLSGGTALSAYYLKHRISDDLDFFSEHDFDTVFIYALAREIGEALSATNTRFVRHHDRYQFFYAVPGQPEEYRIEFARYPFKQLRSPIRRDGILIDSELDIAVNKLMAITDRFDPKDFVDLYFLLQQYPLTELKSKLEQKFGVIVSPIFLGSELSKARRIAALPKMLKPLTIEDLKNFFSQQAQSLRSQVLEE